MKDMTSAMFVGLLAAVAGCYVHASTEPPAPQQASRPAYAIPPGTPPQIAPPPARPVGHTPLSPSATAMTARSIRADCPQGLGPQHLGLPLDANFNPMIGAGSGSLFPQAGPPMAMTVNTMQHDQELVQTMEHFNATLRYLVYNGDVSVAQKKRFGIYRAVQLTQVYELRDNTPMSAPPAGAVYYPWRIYVGHAYTEVVEGDYTTFTADVGAKFLTWGGNAGVERAKYSLRSQVAGRGLVPVSGQSIFAHGPQEIAQQYRANGPPVPILVEYRQIPNTRTVDGQIVWVQPKTVTVRFSNLQVNSTGAALYSYATWDMSFQCMVNGQAAGPPQPFQQTVSPGNYPLTFSQQLQVTDTDVIECFAGGQYKRAGDWVALGRSSTGPISAGRMPGQMGSTMEGRDAKSAYVVTWSAWR